MLICNKSNCKVYYDNDKIEIDIPEVCSICKEGTLVSVDVSSSSLYENLTCIRIPHNDADGIITWINNSNQIPKLKFSVVAEKEYNEKVIIVPFDKIDHNLINELVNEYNLRFP